MRPTQNSLALRLQRLALLAGVGLVLHCSPSLPTAHAVAPAAVGAAKSAAPPTRRSDLMVNTTDDRGHGSLRRAILDANARDGPDTIRFDSITGPFATPQTITLESGLPDLVGELTIDGYIEGRLWKPSGVTVSGANAHRVFHVAPNATIAISSLTVAEGRAQQGAGIANLGTLIVRGVTFEGNVADNEGGGLANLGGTLTVVNSTFVDNGAGNAGGGLADLDGKVTVTNSTFSGNSAQQGGAIFSQGALLLRNTILANSEGGADCVAAGTLEPASTHNLIETNEGCGQPISTADPRLGKLGRYNGPTPTLPLQGRSPAVNAGDNASALDEHGKPLRWDQRGNGDPRYAAGITDIGAFEQQALTRLMVDTVEDTDLRFCVRGPTDCTLRGAMALANATSEPDVITFDPKVFSDSQTITLTHPLPEVTADLTLDAAATGGVTLGGDFATLRAAPNVKLTLEGVVVDE